MSPLYLYNNKLLVVNGALATSNYCCCGGSGTGCCPTAFPTNCYNLLLQYSTGLSGTSQAFDIKWERPPCDSVTYKEYLVSNEIMALSYNNPTIGKCQEIASSVQSAITLTIDTGGQGETSSGFNDLSNESCYCIHNEETGENWSYGSIIPIICPSCCSGSAILNESSGCYLGGQTYTYRRAESTAAATYTNLPSTSQFGSLQCFDGCCQCTGGTIADSCNVVFTVDSYTICSGLLSDCGWCGICCKGGEYLIHCSYGDTPNGIITITHKLNCSKCCANDSLLECTLGDLVSTIVNCYDIPPETCVGSTASISLDCTAPYPWCSNCDCEYNISGNEFITVEVNTPDGNFTVSGTSNYLSDESGNSISIDCTSYYDSCETPAAEGFGVNITVVVGGDFTKTYTGHVDAASSYDCSLQKPLTGLSFTIKKNDCTAGTASIS